ncbi:MBL fold metallo-hydrolase [Klebsiella aerogenes]|uniref:MBL fold metallo-hydrolase n=1 Tax=Klebsiella aerogenes TaxID=548 RepID=UPI00063C179E|nr:MBL fold metallo-hydrolase [Klebsiella aerogenes]EKU8182057.1 MBL fold metallo-hydrolase [Klebsiella aerogenes]ELA1937964.1 MBL fold metallo-hydrolase [Klebsiella aerogenes]ELA2019009.1 MBL fold metallo-hydrolase [Klebsiella aerogenes]KLF08479.1 beta-lactamase [Klebsiella aerogenes]HBV9990858.1 MBL fold metallo-hydrolase [Klebsiella aerogenes]
MTITLCKACGTSYEFSGGPTQQHCPICEDERQFVPVGGQQWITLNKLTASHNNKWQQHNSGLFSIRTIPSFAINQRAFLLRTPQGNILWDCIANLDEATKTLVSVLGDLKAIAISHPHYYSCMQDWAAEFKAPIYLHGDDRQWVMRDSPWITFWEGDSLQLTADASLIRLGGHFAGGCVLHWAQGDGLLLSGDIVQVAPGANAVSFMWSYPNMLPLPAATVSDILRRLDGVKFSQIYGAFEGREILVNAQEIVRQSGKKYVACLARHSV